MRFEISTFFSKLMATQERAMEFFIIESLEDYKTNTLTILRSNDEV